MKVEAQDYETARDWLAFMSPEVFPSARPESDPILALDRIFATSPANARKGLAMALGDVVEATAFWPMDRVAAIDRSLKLRNLPTLTEMRLRFSKLINRVVRRGSIKSDVEYYAVRNAVELAENEGALWVLLAAYEAQPR